MTASNRLILYWE